MTEQENAIVKLNAQLAKALAHRSLSPVSRHSEEGQSGGASAVVCRSRRGKAPLVDPFTGENPEVRLDDWLPSLQRASTWNDWTEEELLFTTGRTTS